MLNIAGIIDILFKSDESFTAEDVIDQLNFGASVYILAFFAVLTGSKQHFGNPIQCIAPAESSDSWVNYYHDYCFIQDKVVLNNWNFGSQVNSTKIGRETPRVAYYQWVPYVLFLQALFFLMPRLVRKCASSYLSKGCDIDCVLGEAGRLKEKLGKERVDGLQTLSAFISQMLKWKKTKAVFGGCSLSFNYVLCKVLMTVNSVAQWYILSQFVGGGDYYWGFQIMDHVLGNTNIEPTQGIFPRIVQCKVDLRQLSSMHTINMQCVLMLNYINEKIYVFLYFWLLVISVANILSLMKYTIFVCFSSYQLKMISSLIPLQSIVPLSSTHTFERHIHKSIGPDGIILLMFIEKHAGGLIAFEIAKILFKSISPKLRHKFLASDEGKESSHWGLEDKNDSYLPINEKGDFGSHMEGQGRSRSVSIGQHSKPFESGSSDITLPLDSTLNEPDRRHAIGIMDNRMYS